MSPRVRRPSDRLGAGALTALLLAGLGACTDASGSPEASSSTAILSTSGPVAAAPTQLLGLMQMAATTVTFGGQRRYEAHWTLDGSPQQLIYREDVITDGTGRFSIDTTEVIAPNLSTSQEDLFLLLQKTRQGFFFNHRDFAIRDMALLLQNWVVTDLGTTTFLGRSCTLLNVQRQQAPASYYELTVDNQNGLVLRAEEREMTGGLLSISEFETLSLMPSLTGVVWHQGVTTETVIESSLTQLAELSFIPVQPKLLPPGYELVETAAVVEPGQTGEWARFSYSDGVEELFFLHQGVAAQQGATSAGGPTAGTGAGTGSGSQGAGKGPKNNQDVVNYTHVGPWTLVFGEIDDEAFLALGKVSREELRDMVESAFF